MKLKIFRRHFAEISLTDRRTDVFPSTNGVLFLHR